MANISIPSETQIVAAIKALPLDLRKVFVMTYVERRPRTEIAAALHLSAEQLEERIAEAVEGALRGVREMSMGERDDSR